MFTDRGRCGRGGERSGGMRRGGGVEEEGLCECSKALLDAGWGYVWGDLMSHVDLKRNNKLHVSIAYFFPMSHVKFKIW